MTLSSGTGTLLGTTTADIGTGAGNGTATFTNLQINVAGSKTLTATAATVLGFVASNAFTVAPAAASQLVFTTQPGSATAGARARAAASGATPGMRCSVVASADALAASLAQHRTWLGFLRADDVTPAVHGLDDVVTRLRRLDVDADELARIAAEHDNLWAAVALHPNEAPRLAAAGGLVAAYAEIEALARHAIEKRYRFFSYGDAMLLFPQPGQGA